MTVYCTFYIVRHGETEWNAKGLLQGHSDIPLSKTGILQAQNLAQELKTVTFDKVYSSDLLRTVKTAEILVLERKLVIETTKQLRERTWGKLEGKQSSNLQNLQKTLEKLTNKERFSHKIDPSMESDEEIVTRFITFLREVAVAHPGKTILIASHGGVMRAFLIHIGLESYRNLKHYAIKNTGYIKVRCDGVDFFVDKTKGVEGLEE